VERTFAWQGRHHRLSKDDEALSETDEAEISIVMTRLTVAGWPDEGFSDSL